MPKPVSVDERERERDSNRNGFYLSLSLREEQLVLAGISEIVLYNLTHD